MDYSKFLGKKDETVLAYLGGPFAYGKDRRVRVAEPRPENGFHTFEIKGRTATAVARDESPDLGKLPRVRGHHVRGWVVGGHPLLPRSKSRIERIELMPAEEPMPFAILRARRWHSGDIVFESVDFDTEVEEAARLRLEQKAPLGEMKGAPLSLRTAYGVALAFAFAADMGIALSVREALPVAGKVAADGEAVARPFLVQLDARRAEEVERARIRAIVEGRKPTTQPVAYRTNTRDIPTLDNAALRAEAALDAAHARLLSSRSLGNGNIEVSWNFMGQRFISVVDALTLHVYDSGVCLAGADELVTLESLPSVIRQAIDEDALVITRH